MAKIVSLFNHKGGVSKTTTTFNLGWALASLGKRVLLVDGDPQCNLTGMVLGFDGKSDFDVFYTQNPDANLCAGLAPVFASQKALTPAKVVATTKSGMQLLAGHIDLSDYEAQMAVAFTTPVALPALRNMPGSVGALLRMTAEENEVDVVLVDMSPSIGAFNQAIFLGSDFFFVPTSPDYFCLLAVDSLAKVLPKWNAGATSFRTGVTYPLPPNGPTFIGMISQKYRPRNGSPAKAFQHWIDAVKTRVSSSLVPALAAQQMSVTAKQFASAGCGDTPFNLANIADFNGLIARSQALQKPPFALTDSELQVGGDVLDNMKKSRDDFNETFEALAKSVITLTGI
ncbi:ParA family protein [Corallococcus sp. EGB]|uniref:ParA family protein n=1 Tax=Corallococcus sp. EGB TaxID=1521117 RepID=UPI001CBFC404|nr:ParA family protein [Corallococcus sp. EGB]